MVTAVNFARAHDLLLSVRGGGHSYPGYSTCDGGLIIDNSQLRDVGVNTEKRIATVSPGCWGADVDAATQALVELPVSDLLQDGPYPEDVVRAAAPDWAMAAALASWGAAT